MFPDTSHDNLIKLKKLTDEICAFEQDKISEDYENKKIINEIKETIDSETQNIKLVNSEYEKLKCYEKMFLKLNNILNKFNFKLNVNTK